MVKFSKTVGLTDMGVTIVTQWWSHAFYIPPIFSKSRPKLLKWCYVPGRLYIGLFNCKVLKKSMRAFSNKIRLNIFYEKMKDSLCFLLIHQDHFFPVWLRRPFYHVLNMWHRTTYSTAWNYWPIGTRPNLCTAVDLCREFTAAGRIPQPRPRRTWPNAAVSLKRYAAVEKQ